MTRLSRSRRSSRRRRCSRISRPARGAPEKQERGRIKGYYEILCRELGDEADVAALLSSLKHYISYIY